MNQPITTPQTFNDLEQWLNQHRVTEIECLVPGPGRFWPEHLGEPPVAQVIVSPRDPKGPHVVEIPAQEMDGQVLEDFVGQGYGIFSGGEVQWARLRFSQERARWVAHETWHPKQEITWLPDGRMEMRLPFTDLRELTLDVLRHGAHVEVLEPVQLREKLKTELAHAMQAYA